MTPETHAVYRVRSNLNRVRRNLEALVEERRRYPDSNVTIEIGVIVMRHNEHEVESFLDWAKDIGADEASVIDPCVRNVVEAHQMLPNDRRYWFHVSGWPMQRKAWTRCSPRMARPGAILRRWRQGCVTDTSLAVARRLPVSRHCEHLSSTKWKWPHL